MKYEMFTKHKIFFYFVGSWYSAYRLHPRILPDLRNLAKLGHPKLYPRFCWTLYWSPWSCASLLKPNHTRTARTHRALFPPSLSWRMKPKLAAAIKARKKALGMGRKTHPFRRQQPSKPSGWLATRPFVGKLIDITKFKCARQRRRSDSNEFPYLHSWEVGEKEDIQMLLKNDQPLYQWSDSLSMIKASKNSIWCYQKV